MGDVKRVIETALKTYGDLDIVINNAGIGEQLGVNKIRRNFYE